MLSRRHWITEFIGHVPRRGLSSDPDWVFDSANELYSEWGGVDPDLAADSALVLTADPKNNNTPIA
jgi:hypothetical protein